MVDDFDADDPFGAPAPGEEDGLEGEFDFSDVDESELEGGLFLPAGFYVMDVLEPLYKTGTNASIVHTFQVVAPRKMAGRKQSEYLSLAPTNMRRVGIFAVRLGLASKEELARKRVAINWKKAKGRRVVVQIKDNVYEDKNGVQQRNTKLEYAGIWPIDHPDIQDKLAELGYGPSGGGPKKPPASGNGTAAPPRPTPKKPAAGKKPAPPPEEDGEGEVEIDDI